MSDIEYSPSVAETELDLSSRTLPPSTVEGRSRNTKGRFQKGSKKMATQSTPSPPPVPEEVLQNIVERLSKMEQENSMLRAQLAGVQSRPVPSVEDPPVTSGALGEESSRRHRRSKERRRHRTASSSSDGSYHSVRPQAKTKIINTIDKLDDGKNPEWEAWLIAIKGRLEFNKDHYPTEAERKFLVYSHTSGRAELHLRYRYVATDDQQFGTWEDMIKWLAPLYVKPFDKELKKRSYDMLQQGDFEPFHEFHAKFMSLAVQAGIHPSSYLPDMKAKINDILASKTTYAARHATTVEEYCEDLQYVDADRQMRLERKKHRATRDKPIESTGSSSKSPAAITVSASVLPRVKVAPLTSYERAKSATPVQVPKATTPVPSGEPTCYECGEKGHIRRDCPQKVAIRKVDVDEEESASDSSASEQGKEKA